MILLWPLDAPTEEAPPEPIVTWRGHIPEPPKFRYLDERRWLFSRRWPFVRRVRGVIAPL